MKNKKFNLEKRIAECNFDVTKNFKYYLIAPAVLLVVALVLLFTVGFAKSIDFTGGSIARVYIGETYTFDQGKEKVDQILTSKGLQASVYQLTEDEYGENFLIVKYKNKQDATQNQITTVNLEIVDQLYQAFGYDKQDVQQAKFVEGNLSVDAMVGKQATVNAFGGLVLASVLVVVYFLIRYGHRSAATTLLCVYHDLLITLCLALIFRVELNLTFLSGLMVVTAFSFVNNALMFAAIKRHTEEKLSAKTIVNNAIKSHFKFELLMVWLVAIMFILFSIVGVSSILPFSILALFGTLSSFFSTTFLAPNLWALVYMPAKKKVKKQQTTEVA